MNSLGIYFHVPFCGKKCGYCDFYSVKYSRELACGYVDAVLRNIRNYSDSNYIVDTIYFGGGTPSLLNAEQIEKILSETSNSFHIAENPEITLEANPNTLNSEKLRDLHNIGINRLSFGVQSLVDKELKFLGRSHDSKRALTAVYDAYNAGFENISCDLMIGIPMQTHESMKYSISGLAELPIQHISAYILKTEKGTPFDCNEIKNILPDEDFTSELYLEMVRLMEEHGFIQYEVSNFSKPGFESKHNCRYWKCLDYLGIGPGAHSCFKGKRFAAEKNLRLFIDSCVQPNFITDETPCGFEERAMLRLRLRDGLNIGETGSHRFEIEKKIPRLVEAGYAEFNGTTLSLTPKGFLMSNSIIGYLIFD